MDSNDDMAADMAMMWKVTWQSHVTWQQQHSPQVDGPNSEWATKLDLIFNPFIRIVITAQNTYQNCKTISHSIKSNTISRIYIEKHLKIEGYIHIFILHQKQRTKNKNNKSSSIYLQISNLFSLLVPCSISPAPRGDQVTSEATRSIGGAGP